MSTDQSANISFTVPHSGRRYTIWLEDWISIRSHIEVARLARKTLSEKKE